MTPILKYNRKNKVENIQIQRIMYLQMYLKNSQTFRNNQKKLQNYHLFQKTKIILKKWDKKESKKKKKKAKKKWTGKK